MTQVFNDAAGKTTAPYSNRPRLIWVAVCLLATLIGFALGQHFRQPIVSPNLPTVTNAPGHLRPALVLNEFTISDAVNKARSCVVAVDVDGPSVPESDDHVLPTLNPIEPSTAKAIGAGVIVRADGYILTSNHVVKAGDTIKVELDDKRVFAGKLIGEDPYTDLALIKIPAVNLPVANLSDRQEILPGQWAIAIGSPMRLDHSVSLGIVSAVGRNISGPAAKVELIQTDAAINPGNSGGPLLNIQGQVIGINTAMRHDAQNIGFAVPIGIAQKVANNLIEHSAVPQH